MYERLKQLVIEEQNKNRKTSLFFVENGYYESWHLDHHQTNDNGIKEHSTARRWQQYNAREITREKAVELAQTRVNKDYDKRLAEKLQKFEAIENAPTLTWATITVEWKRNQTWGNNPSVEIRSNNGVTFGHASGCGYDKESAAIGSAMNDNPAFLKILYDMKENGLANPPELGRALNPFNPEPIREANTSSNSICGYGAGYGALPYFEGGVGSSCFWRILEKAGYKVKTAASGKRFDVYEVEKC